MRHSWFIWDTLNNVAWSRGIQPEQWLEIGDVAQKSELTSTVKLEKK